MTPSLPSVVNLSAVCVTRAERDRALRELRRIARYIPVGKAYQVHRPNQMAVDLIIEDVPGDATVLASATAVFSIFLPTIQWRTEDADIYEVDINTGVPLDGKLRLWPERVEPYNEDLVYAEFLASAAVIQHAQALVAASAGK